RSGTGCASPRYPPGSAPAGAHAPRDRSPSARQATPVARRPTGRPRCRSDPGPPSKRSERSSQLIEEEGARLAPVALHRGQRDIQLSRDVLLRHAAEITHFDYPEAALVGTLQLEQGVVEAREIVGDGCTFRDPGGERDRPL